MGCICSSCIKNYGLIKSIKKNSRNNKGYCSICGLPNEILIDDDNVEDVLDLFFRENGRSHIYHHLTFQVFDGKFSKNLIDDELDHSLEVDLNNISKIFRKTVKSWTPPMGLAWGGTELYYEMEEIISGGEDVTVLLSKYFEKLNSFFQIKELPIDSKFYRIRKFSESNKIKLDQNEYDSPPKDRIVEGRLNQKNRNVFYCSNSIETCLFESKFNINDYLVVAECSNVKQMKFLDLTEFRASKIWDNEVSTKWSKDELELLRFGLFWGADYRILQYWSSYIEKHNFDGIIYPSFFDKYGELNRKSIAIFGRPIEKNLIKVKSLNKLSVNNIHYEWTLGPIVGHSDSE